MPRLTFRPQGEMRVEATIGEHRIDEVVKVDVTNVRQNLFIMSWTEKNGNFIVQVQDHENQVVHNYARLADGQLFCAQGELQPVAAA
jgi:hypothetical protein